jgi:hypothetical protein
MNLSVVSESADVINPRARAAMAESVTLADQCLREVRTISYLLHPRELDELGLESALSRYIDGFTQRSGIRVEVEVSPDLGRLPEDVETAVFRVVQECLTNIRIRNDHDLLFDISNLVSAAAPAGDDRPSAARSHRRLSRRSSTASPCPQYPSLSAYFTLSCHQQRSSKRISPQCQTGSLQVALSKTLRRSDSASCSKLIAPERFRYSPRTCRELIGNCALQTALYEWA